MDKNPYENIAKLINQKKIKYVVTIARGTSDCAALYSSYIFAKHLGLPTYSMPPSIITLEQSNFDFSEIFLNLSNGLYTWDVEEKKSHFGLFSFFSNIFIEIWVLFNAKLII